MSNLIKRMVGAVQSARGYGQDGAELSVLVTFDAKEFNRLKKSGCPLSAALPQIKNVVFDATGIRSTPGYAAVSMHQRFPRASKGEITLKLYFDVSPFNFKRLGIERVSYGLYKQIEMQQILEATRLDGHLFAKTALAAALGH